MVNQSSIGENRALHTGPHKEAAGSVKRQRDGGIVGKHIYCGFCRKEWLRQGKQV